MGFPARIRDDQASDSCRSILTCGLPARRHADFSQPGKRTDNAFAKAFNGRFRAECLDTRRFSALRPVQSNVIGDSLDWNQVAETNALIVAGRLGNEGVPIGGSIKARRTLPRFFVIIGFCLRRCAGRSVRRGRWSGVGSAL
ncbi:transposase [Bradyrhizobium sp. Arg62]|nr:transposase [Bradyrhizobium brasilense]